MKKIISLSLLLGLTSLYAGAYTKCAGCHGANGEKAAMGNKSKILKDMTKSEIESSLLGYQNGTYGGALKGLMAGQVRGLSGADITAIANQIGK